ncbi:hypothetical protein [Hydrogenophaga flava]|uniref:hypothetical protein n=1 Tax=Hydrogenophaga flava TaxID=65657 RepID=UPI000824CA41|nr:hypothetical protein [Hydrogenophaga flava]
MSKSDPVRENYYASVDRAEKTADGLFYVTAILSIISLFVERAMYPLEYEIVQTSFAVCVITLFIVGVVNRLYWTPRAEDKRRQDFFASACGVTLSHQKTDGYYNNDLTDPVDRMAAQVMENSHFSKAIVLRMASTERIKVATYGALWFICVLNRHADLGLIVAASQAVFSEQILSKWLRLEWLRIRFENTYDEMHRIFQSKPPTPTFRAQTLESLGKYETAKATAGITLSSSLFHKMNDQLSAEWDLIKADLCI